MVAGELLVVMENDLLGRVMVKYTYMKEEFAKVRKKSLQEEEAALNESLKELTNCGVMKSWAKWSGHPDLP